MTRDLETNELERWRGALASVPAATGGGCAGPEEIWEAANGDLPRAETVALLDHALACPDCLEAWRLARAFDSELEPRVGEAPGRRRRVLAPGGWALGLAAVAAAVWMLVVVPRTEMPGGGPPPVLRAPETTAVRSLIPESVPLPRAAAVLEWTPGPPGSRYDVTVSGAGLEPLAAAIDLEAPRFELPSAAVERLASGDRLLWQVTVRRPDGGSEISATFIHQIE